MLLDVIAVLGLALWIAPLLWMRERNRMQTAAVVDRRARVGVWIEVAGFAVIWIGRLWRASPVPDWQIAVGILLILLAAGMSLAAALALGSLLRIDAGLSQDHKLIRTGPYRLVRHPVYSSMLFLIVGSGLLISPWIPLVVAVWIFIAGTAIRIRVEEELLASRFGAEFESYRRSVPALIPFAGGSTMS